MKKQVTGRRPKMELRTESRRVYFMTLVRIMARQQSISLSEAGRQLLPVLEALQSQILDGRSVDLGFMLLKATRVKPATIKLRFHKKKEGEGEVEDGDTVFMMGETRRWHVSLRKSWLKRHSPVWSRY